MSEMFDEEPWEAEIGAMLGALPSIEPPDGFMAGAVDHRPLHAGRIMLSLLALTLLAVGGVVATGVTGATSITPEVASLYERHDEVTAGAGLGLSLPDRPVETGVAMPDGFVRSGEYAFEGVEVAVYRRGDESVSISVQDGEVDWAGLPSEGLTTIEGRQVWVDESSATVIVQGPDSAVTIIGLGADEVGEVLATVAPPSESSLLDRLTTTADSIVGQLGFPTSD